MKTAFLLFTSSFLLLTVLTSAGARPTPPDAVQGTDHGDKVPIVSDALIEPGESIGPLKIGDSRQRAEELFPRKLEDQQWDDSCGTTLDWVDSNNRDGRGDLSIRLKNDKVFQIESTTTRFQTAEGITTYDPPEKVASAYKNMSAYVLLTQPQPSLGDRPLVFWLDKKKGIAFALAYDASRHKRYLYKIIVFAPHKTFCPEQERIDSPKWQSIHPYALEPPIELSPQTSEIKKARNGLSNAQS